jgi:hypothetical protein
LLLWAAPVHAIELHIRTEGLRLDITESLFAAYHGDLGALIVTQDALGRPTPENQYVDLLNRLDAVLSWRRFRLATRFDTAVFLDTVGGACDPNGSVTLRGRFCQRYFYPEKLSLEYAGRTIEATLGDFYVSFGRGIVLSLRKLDELGIDTTLLGGRLVFHEGDTAAVLVAGATNIQNVDEATGRVADDPYDAVAGGRVEHRIADRLSLGLHLTGGVNRRNGNTMFQLRPDAMLMYGGSIDAPRLFRWLGLYFEADGQMSQIADARANGYALYGAATAYAGPVVILLEAKHYSQLQRWRSSVDPSLPEFAPVAYNNPPTAERIVTELTAPVYDVSGPRVRADWRVNPALLLYASYAFFADRALGRDYHDPYGGFELRWSGGASHFFGSGGYREELCASDACFADAPSGEYQHIGHVEWDATQVLPRRLSLESQGQALFRDGDRTNASWTEGNAYLALKWSPWLQFTGGFEWSTRPPPTNTAVNQYYGNGAIQWNITTASSIRLWGGGSRGGLRCISGLCRIFPPFTGARLELVIRL